MTADDALAATAADPEERTARELAAGWLKEALSNGPVMASNLRAAANESGLAWRTVRRAQAVAGVKVGRRGFGPGAAWFWYLPGPLTGPPP